MGEVERGIITRVRGSGVRPSVAVIAAAAVGQALQRVVLTPLGCYPLPCTYQVPGTAM
jgi:hypothetical protein